VAGSLSWNLKR